MIFNFLSVVLPFITTYYFTFSYYETFYQTAPHFLYFICVSSCVISLLLTIPTLNTGRKWSRFLFLFSPYFLVYTITYNLFFALITIVFCMVISFLFFRKSSYKRILFTDLNTPFTVHYTKKKTFKELYGRFAKVLSGTVIGLFILTCIFTTPTKLWQIRAFPIDLSVKKTLSGTVSPSGHVTNTIWYDTSAIYVHDVFTIPTPDGEVSPCIDAGMQKGDIITHINGEKAATCSFLENGADGTSVTLDVLRILPSGKLKNHTFTLTPVYSEEEERYLIGMTYTPSAPVATSIQTLSFTYPDTGYFASTAHSSEDVYTKTEDLSGGLHVSVPQGRDELGIVATPVEPEIGLVLEDNTYGAFGAMLPLSAQPLPIALKSEVKLGSATLLSNCGGGEVIEYDIFVTGTYRIEEKDVFCFIVTDNRLTQMGGIARGMSGSPIIQQGKIIGALCNMDKGGYSAYATFAHDMAHQLYLTAQEFEKSIN